MSLIGLRSERGQASVEYLAALVIGLIIVLALGGLFRGYSNSGGVRPDSATGKTLRQAPYSLPTNEGGGSMQWAKDLLMH